MIRRGEHCWYMYKTVGIFSLTLRNWIVVNKAKTSIISIVRVYFITFKLESHWHQNLFIIFWIQCSGMLRPKLTARISIRVIDVAFSCLGWTVHFYRASVENFWETCGENDYFASTFLYFTHGRFLSKKIFVPMSNALVFHWKDISTNDKAKTGQTSDGTY